MKRKSIGVTDITFVGVMAAMIYVVTMFRFPLLESKVHFANALCLVAGMLLGPVQGGLAAGLGSGLYDAFTGGYGIVEALITFVSKFAMAWVCGALVYRNAKRLNRPEHTVPACVCGALTYVALYMLKTFIFQRFVHGYPVDKVWATMLAKLVPSLINAGVAIVAAPLFFHALLPALRASGVLQHMAAGAPEN